MKKYTRRLMAGCAMALTLATSALALDTGKPIRLIVAAPAGNVTDLSARILAEGLSRKLSQSVYVENIPGGDSTLGLLELVRSAPDGNTIFAGGLGGQLLPPLIKKKFPVDVEKDLTKLARYAEFSNILIVNKDVPVNSVQELIDYAKANPGKLSYAASGIATSSRLVAELFMQRTGTEFMLIPYDGTPGALNDVAAGFTQVMFPTLPAAVGLIDSGDVKALAITGPARSKELPDVPTMGEAGLADFTVTSWNSIFGPAGMKPEDVKLLGESIIAVVKEPAAQEALAKIGFTPVYEESEAFARTFAAEKALWGGVIDKAGIREQ